MIRINLLSKKLVNSVRSRRYYASLKQNPEKHAAHRAKVKAWKQAHPEAVRLSNAKDIAKLLSKNPNYFREWVNNNREKQRAYDAKCRAKRRALQEASAADEHGVNLAEQPEQEHGGEQGLHGPSLT